ncbi:hypothetical protein [Pseudooceanicola onchidii]|uniref:hypothetical protein n=1 Tax=Pseudooceanicola onchidii TaxID=2562279 RepID=UPI0010AA859F|nr:hypothetical protein [Pseudooceanicola onchidii]
MFKKTLTAAGIALIAATPVLAVEGPFPVGEIATETNFDSMKNPNALDYYPEVAADINAAISERAKVDPGMGERPVDLEVRILSMRLNDDPVLTGDGAFNMLEGLVTVEDSANGKTVISQPILLNAEEMEVPYLSVSPENRDFYNAMVLAFADRAVEIANSVDELPDLEQVQK